MPPKTKKSDAIPHPTYKVMIREAIVTLKERTGSSQQALRKFIGAKYDLPSGWEKKLRLYLKKMTYDGLLVQVKASWKLGDKLKQQPTKPKKVTKKAPATEKKKTAKPKAQTKKKPVKKSAQTKPKTKKAAPKKTTKKRPAPKKAPTTPTKKVVKKAKTGATKSTRASTRVKK